MPFIFKPFQTKDWFFTNTYFVENLRLDHQWLHLHPFITKAFSSYSPSSSRPPNALLYSCRCSDPDIIFNSCEPTMKLVYKCHWDFQIRASDHLTRLGWIYSSEKSHDTICDNLSYAKCTNSVRRKRHFASWKPLKIRTASHLLNYAFHRDG